MSHSVLRHRGLPLVHAREKRFGTQPENLLQFIANDTDDLIVCERPNIFGSRSGEKASEQGAVFRRAVRKFVVNESCREQSLALTSRNEESEARRKRLTNLAIVAQAHRD